jgi:hypothetical protein
MFFIGYELFRQVTVKCLLWRKLSFIEFFRRIKKFIGDIPLEKVIHLLLIVRECVQIYRNPNCTT